MRDLVKGTIKVLTWFLLIIGPDISKMNKHYTGEGIRVIGSIKLGFLFFDLTRILVYGWTEDQNVAENRDLIVRTI